MNDQATLLCYLAYNSLKKLVKSAELIDIFPREPYATICVSVPFEIQLELQTVLMEDLRGVIKEGGYKLFEMMSSVAKDYAEHKKLDLELDEDSDVAILFETPHLLMQVASDSCASELELPFKCDILDVKTDQDMTYITFGFGDEVKTLKKILNKTSGFVLSDYLVRAGYVTVEGFFKERMDQLLNYYKAIFLTPLRELGVTYLSDANELEAGCATFSSQDVVKDPLILGSLVTQEFELHAKLPLSFKKSNSCLKSLIKILKMLEFRIQINFQGKFPDSDMRDLCFEIEDSIFSRGDVRSVKIDVLDSLKRLTSVCQLTFTKKFMICKIDVLRIILTHLLQHHKAYPSAFLRPKQIAVCGLMQKHPILAQQLLEAQLTGCCAFAVEQKDLIDDKQALDYQIDKLLYWSESEAKVKDKSYS